MYPTFASSPFANYVVDGPLREDPIEGSFQAYAASDNENWKRLTRTIDVPATGATSYDFQISYDVETDYDFVLVEVRTPAATTGRRCPRRTA